MGKKFTARKYDGDDMYSWAVFYTKDVKGMGSLIFYGQARPVCTGLDMYEARQMVKRMEASK